MWWRLFCCGVVQLSIALLLAGRGVELSMGEKQAGSFSTESLSWMKAARKKSVDLVFLSESEGAVERKVKCSNSDPDAGIPTLLRNSKVAFRRPTGTSVFANQRRRKQALHAISSGVVLLLSIYLIAQKSSYARPKDTTESPFDADSVLAPREGTADKPTLLPSTHGTTDISSGWWKLFSSHPLEVALTIKIAIIFLVLLLPSAGGLKTPEAKEIPVADIQNKELYSKQSTRENDIGSLEEATVEDVDTDYSSTQSAQEEDSEESTTENVNTGYQSTQITRDTDCSDSTKERLVDLKEHIPVLQRTTAEKLIDTTRSAMLKLVVQSWSGVSENQVHTLMQDLMRDNNHLPLQLRILLTHNGDTQRWTKTGRTFPAAMKTKRPTKTLIREASVSIDGITNSTVMVLLIYY